MANTNLLCGDLTEKILKEFYHVYNTLGYGFLEKVYQNALSLRLERSGMKVGHRVPVSVYFEGVVVGEYFADLIVADRVIIELKSCSSIDKAHEAQLINYLRATSIEVGLVLNFGESPQFSRKVYANTRKKALPPT